MLFGTTVFRSFVLAIIWRKQLLGLIWWYALLATTICLLSRMVESLRLAPGSHL